MNGRPLLGLSKQPYYILDNYSLTLYNTNIGGLNMTIKELRTITGLSQSKFALKYHINLTNLHNWEQGVYKTPETTLYLLERLITEVDYMEQLDAQRR